jgi:hypothetical protein
MVLSLPALRTSRVLTGLALSATAGAQMAPPLFPEQRVMLPGFTPLELAVADTNRDGLDDLVVATHASVLVLRSLGEGRFEPPAVYPVAGGFTLPDVLVTVPNALAVLAGMPGGDFAPAQHHPVGASPRRPAVGDLNGDGITDIAVPGAAAGSVTLLFGTGGGGFQPAFNFVVGEGLESLDIGDADGDGKLDLFLAGPLTKLMVLKGHGDGSFELMAELWQGSTMVEVVAADVQGDGRLDLVVTLADDAVRIWRGDGAGGFAPVQDIDVLDPTQALVRDLDADGRPELVIASLWSIDTWSAGGGGSFVQGQSLELIGCFARMLAAGDVDGDGRADLASSCQVGFGAIDLARGRGDGTWSVPAPLPVLDPDQSYSAYGAVGLALADVTGDTVSDLLVADRPSGVTGLELWCHAGRGDGSFRAPLLTPAPGPTGISALVTGDLDQDGLTDVIVGGFGSSTFVSFLSDGSGAFGAPAGTIPWPAANVVEVALADMDGDTVLDLVTLHGTLKVVSVVPGLGDGTFGTPYPLVPIELLSPTALVVADMDADGAQDLVVVRSGSNGVRVFLGHGDGTFDATGLAAAAAYGDVVADAAAADLNHDGLPDLVVPQFHFLAQSNEQGRVSVLLGTGGGNLGAATAWPSVTYEGNAGLVALADADGDGELDVVVADIVGYQSFVVTVLPGLGDGTLGPASSYSGVRDVDRLVVGDVNGDGYADAIVGGQGQLDPTAKVTTLLLNQRGPWRDLGFAHASAALQPQLGGGGSLEGGSSCLVNLHDLPPGGRATLFVGFTALHAPFQGGVLVPDPAVALLLQADATGEVALPFVMPFGVPAGATLLLQAFANAGPGTPTAASNALLATTP